MHRIPHDSRPRARHPARPRTSADRIGEHAAEHAPPWAVSALGPVPADRPAGLGWTRRAAAIGTYRELAGYNHPTDPIGPEPAGDSPDKRAAWHAALAALGPASGGDVRGLPDGQLLHLRDTYPVETAWAPRWAGDQLRQVRLAGEHARLEAIRGAAEAKTAVDHGRAGIAARHEELAASYQALHAAYTERETILAAVMDDRAVWDKSTTARRRLAVAADAELRRRHPDQHYPPLRSAEPEPVTAAEASELTLTIARPAPPAPQWLAELASARPAFAAELAVRERDSDHDILPAVPAWMTPAPDALLQPPRSPIRPSARVLELARERDADREAAH
jgi:hypothetical protein